MADRPNFKKPLRILNEEHAEYLIVGGYAVMKYTEPRFQFTHAWQNRATGIFFGIPVHFISLRDLVLNKRAAGRSSDLEQLERLQKETDKGHLNRGSND